MTMQYTPFDRDLCNSAVLTLIGSEIDKEEKTNISFQFPPKVVRDSRKGTWLENEDAGGREMIANYKVSGSREMTMNITYIVDGGEWNVDRVASQVQLLRGYFARARLKGTDRNLIILLQLWNLGGPKLMSFRIKDVGVKYSDNLVAPFKQPERAFPIRSDITLELRMWTRGGALSVITAEGGATSLEKEADAVQRLGPNMAPTELASWY